MGLRGKTTAGRWILCCLWGAEALAAVFFALRLFTDPDDSGLLGIGALLLLCASVDLLGRRLTQRDAERTAQHEDLAAQKQEILDVIAGACAEAGIDYPAAKRCLHSVKDAS